MTKKKKTTEPAAEQVVVEANWPDPAGDAYLVGDAGQVIEVPADTGTVVEVPADDEAPGDA